MVIEKQEELIALERPFELDYYWSTGPYMQRFFEGLKQGRIVANRCYECKRIIIPPMNVCGRCHREMGEFEVLASKGEIISFAYVVDPLFDSGLGEMREVPYISITIVLDGAPDATFTHILSHSDPDKVDIGQRVEAVFRPESERKGLMSDIMYFKPIG